MLLQIAEAPEFLDVIPEEISVERGMEQWHIY